MFGAKYAQKDASKVNTYEIAQLSRASAGPAKFMCSRGQVKEELGED